MNVIAALEIFGEKSVLPEAMRALEVATSPRERQALVRLIYKLGGDPTKPLGPSDTKPPKKA